MQNIQVKKDEEKEKGIRVVPLNIRSGQLGGLKAALHALQKGNVDIGVLQETKLTQGIHTQHGSGYDVWET